MSFISPIENDFAKIGKASTDPCVSIILELARAHESGDPFAFRLEPAGYILRRADGTFASGFLDWDAALLADLAASRSLHRDPVVLQRLGEKLRRFLLPLGWPEYENELQAALASNHRVHLSLRFAAAELYALPWELLTIGSSGQHLGELPNVLLRYEWPGTTTGYENGKEAARSEGGRVLYAWSAAGGEIPAAAMLGPIENAVQAGQLSFDRDRDMLAHASLARLSAVLESAQREAQPFRVLHLLCHGAAQGSVFGLVLDDPEAEDGVQLIDGGKLRQTLAPFAETLRLVVLCACDGGNSGAIANELGSVAQALHRVGIAAVVASRYPLSTVGAVTLTETLYRELFVNLQSLESALLTTRRRLFQHAGALDWTSLQLYIRAADGDDNRPVVFRPFRGLLTYQPEHSRLFVSRGQEIAEVLGDLRALAAAGRPRFLIVAGASGSGKSSLVLAGVVPALMAENKNSLHVVRLRPSHPEALADIEQELPKAPTQTLIIVDQFEELFTHMADGNARQTWVKKLWQLSQAPQGQVMVIVTLRVDFIGRCGEILLDTEGQRLEQIAYDEAHRVFVAQLSPAQLAMAITVPLSKVGLSLEPGLLQQLLRDVGAEPGALPALAYTLDLLWEHRQGRLLTQAAYSEFGGIAGALRGRAEGLVAAMNEAEQRATRRMLVRLCAIGDDPSQCTRRRVPLAALSPKGTEATANFTAVLARLVDARLLVCDGEGEQAAAEIAHEALIRNWPQLIDWVRSDQQLLIELGKLETWALERKHHGTLLIGDQLVYAEGVVEKHQEECSPAVLKLLAESQAARQLQRRVRQAVIAALTVATIIAVFFAWYGLRSARSARAAQKEEATARNQADLARKAESLSREALQRELLDSYVERGRQLLIERNDPVRAILWLQRGYQAGHDTPALRLLLSQAYFALGRLRPLLPGTQPVFSPDGCCLTTEQGGQVQVWDARSGLLLQRVPGEAASFRQDGKQLVVVQEDGKSAAIIDSRSGNSLLQLRAPDVTMRRIIFSPDSSVLASLSRDQTSLSLWRAIDGSKLSTIAITAPSSPDMARRLYFSADSRRIVIAGAGPASVFNVQNGSRLWERSGAEHPGTLFSDYSAQGDRLVITWAADKECHDDVEIWEATHGNRVSALRKGACPNSAVLRPDGAQLITQTMGEGITLHDWQLQTESHLPFLTDEELPNLLSPNGSLLFARDEDHVGMIWDTADGKLLQTVAVVGTATAFSPDGSLLAVLEEGGIRVVDVGLLRSLPGLAGSQRVAPLNGPARFDGQKSPDGRFKLVITESGVVFIQPVDSTQPSLRLEANGSYNDRSFTRSGEYAVTWSLEDPPAGHEVILKDLVVSDARVWDVKTGALLMKQEDETAARIVDSLHPNGTWVRTANGQPWELLPQVPNKSQLSQALRCQVPLRFAGEFLVPVEQSPNRTSCSGE